MLVLDAYKILLRTKMLLQIISRKYGSITMS
jgi:hypothetical protein